MPLLQRAIQRTLRAKPYYRGTALRLTGLQRGMVLFLIGMFILGPGTLEVLGSQSSLYNQIQTSDWGEDNRTVTYEYDANGSLTRKVTTTTDTSTELEDVAYLYNLQDRLARIQKDWTDSGDTYRDTTEYTYNSAGIRVEENFVQSINGADDPNSVYSTKYLVDPFNSTGYAQALIEKTTTASGESQKSYIIGHDVLGHVTSAGEKRFYSMDGHGSTRQLTNPDGNVTDYYSYDAYGVMLGGNPTNANPAATSLLYAGEQFDTNAQQYYLRARYYDPLNGRFNRTDPYAGNNQDPLSLHRYAYAHNNPVNFVDPSGEFSITEINFVGWARAALFVANIHYFVQNTRTALISGINAFNALMRGDIVAFYAGVISALFYGYLAYLNFIGIGSVWNSFINGGGAILASSGATIGNTALKVWVVKEAGPAVASLIIRFAIDSDSAKLDPEGSSGGGSSGSNNASPQKKLWNIDKYDKSIKVGNHVYYRDPEALSPNGKRLWWSRDTAGHGGSAWKVYEEFSGRLKWYRDADEYGNFIDPSAKHKGPVGLEIPLK